MNNLEQMQAEIAKLSPEEFRKLSHWMDEKRATEWDRALEDAASNGTLAAQVARMTRSEF